MKRIFMKRIFILLVIVYFSLVCCSCELISSKSYSHNQNYFLIDETSLYNDKYYAKAKIINNKVDNYIDIYDKKTNELIDKIKINVSGPRLYIYNDYIYLTYEDGDLFWYSYKKLGEKNDIKQNLKSIEKINFNGFLEINKELFFKPVEGNLRKVGYDISQYNVFDVSQKYFYTLYPEPQYYKVEISSEEKYLKIKGISNNQEYKYDFSDEIIEANYNYKTNYAYSNWPKWNEEENLFFIQKNAVFLSDNSLYFSYAKYLGEFNNAKHYCSFPTHCLFSNCKTEILRFNCNNEQIESIGILPDGYIVLKIYDNGALIMKNNSIAEFNFTTKEVSNLQVFNWDEYYELNNDFYGLKIKLNNNEISDVSTYYRRILICQNFDFYED